MQPGDSVTIHVNQGDREAQCIAVLGDLALVEYEMPKGTTGLRLVNPQGGDRSISYAELSRAWLQAVADGPGWIAEPQQGGKVPELPPASE